MIESRSAHSAGGRGGRCVRGDGRGSSGYDSTFQETTLVLISPARACRWDTHGGTRSGPSAASLPWAGTASALQRVRSVGAEQWTHAIGHLAVIRRQCGASGITLCNDKTSARQVDGLPGLRLSEAQPIARVPCMSRGPDRQRRTPGHLSWDAQSRGHRASSVRPGAAPPVLRSSPCGSQERHHQLPQPPLRQEPQHREAARSSEATLVAIYRYVRTSTGRSVRYHRFALR